MNEAHASPAGRGFGPMPCGLGSIPCRIARLAGFAPRRPKGSGPVASARSPYAWRPSSPGDPASGPPRVDRGFPALPGRLTWFPPGAARLPPHPVSPAPTTRHDLASVQRMGGESHGWRGRGLVCADFFQRTDRATTTRCHPCAGRDPIHELAQVESWVPAFAGMTAVAGRWRCGNCRCIVAPLTPSHPPPSEGEVPHRGWGAY